METIERNIEGERVFLKKSGNQWRVVHPWKIDGKVNWKNLIAGGKWSNLLIIAFMVAIILGCIYEYSQARAIADYCLQNTFFP